MLTNQLDALISQIYFWNKTLHVSDIFFNVLLTVQFSIFILVINQLDAQNFCFTKNLFHASTCSEHMCPKHVEATK